MCVHAACGVSQYANINQWCLCVFVSILSVTESVIHRYMVESCTTMKEMARKQRSTCVLDYWLVSTSHPLVLSVTNTHRSWSYEESCKMLLGPSILAPPPPERDFCFVRSKGFASRVLCLWPYVVSVILSTTCLSVFYYTTSTIVFIFLPRVPI